MKRYTFEEKRIYIAEIAFDCRKKDAFDVHKAFIEKFPEHKGSKYEFIPCIGGDSIVKVYKESCFDFIEK